MSDSDVVIRVEGLGKKYALHHEKTERYTALRDVVARQARAAGRLLNPFTLAGQLRKAQRQAAQERAESEEEFWALKDVSFEIRRGERVGIIGRNGAGKSTLLKILSRITEPTTGRVEIRGRVASLLEVGTGFHPELTGRENIYLNGAILGMTRREIRSKFDEIVDFAEVEKFLDTPVKRYSSGMYVRLAFAVAAHLEPEILVVDEVLAVGDASFQKKCLGKMNDVADKEGRTVLFVSHNITAVLKLCNSAILMDSGRLLAMQDARSVADQYLKPAATGIANREAKPSKIGDVILKTYDAYGEQRESFGIGEKIVFCIRFLNPTSTANAVVGIGINTLLGSRVATLHTSFQHPEMININESMNIYADWHECILNEGQYSLGISIYTGNELIDAWEDAGQLIIDGRDYFGTGRLPNPQRQGAIVTKASWRIGDSPIASKIACP